MIKNGVTALGLLFALTAQSAEPRFLEKMRTAEQTPYATIKAAFDLGAPITRDALPDCLSGGRVASLSGASLKNVIYTDTTPDLVASFEATICRLNKEMILKEEIPGVGPIFPGSAAITKFVSLLKLFENWYAGLTVDVRPEKEFVRIDCEKTAVGDTVCTSSHISSEGNWEVTGRNTLRSYNGAIVLKTEIFVGSRAHEVGYTASWNP